MLIDQESGGGGGGTRRDAEWEDARLLEEGRNWGDDPPGERNPETFRARDLSCEGAALFVHDVRVSILSFCVPLAPTPVLAAPGTLPPYHSLSLSLSPFAFPMRLLALLFRSLSFTLFHRSRRRYGRFDAERRYQDDDLRQDFFFRFVPDRSADTKRWYSQFYSACFGQFP